MSLAFVEERSPTIILTPFDLSKERAVSVADAAQHLGKAPKTIRHWMLEGVKRVGAPRPGMQIRIIKLQACYVGDCMVTSMESIVRFSDRLNQSFDVDDTDVEKRSVPIKRISHLAAKSQLDALGY